MMIRNIFYSYKLPIFMVGQLLIIIFLIIPYGYGIIIDRIIAQVGLEIITQSELDELVRQSDIDITEQNIQEILDMRIDRLLLVQMARKENIEIPESRIRITVEQELTRIRQLFPTEYAFQEWLNMQQISLDEMQFRLKNQVTQEILIAQLLRRKTPAIAESEIEEFIKSNPAGAANNQSIRIRHIFLNVNSESGPEIETEIRHKANQIYRELRAGANFRDFAMRYSDDSGTRADGGDLGFIQPGETIPEIEKIAFEMDINQISEPIRSARGFHIIQITEKASPREYLYQRAIERTRAQLLRELRDNIPIKIRL